MDQDKYIKMEIDKQFSNQTTYKRLTPEERNSINERLRYFIIKIVKSTEKLTEMDIQFLRSYMGENLDSNL